MQRDHYKRTHLKEVAIDHANGIFCRYQ